MNTSLFFYRVIKYLKYLIFSANGKGHGIHSPFVFDLVSRVFRNKTDASVVYTIEMIRKRLLSDHRMIEHLDLGAGAVPGETRQRRISDIAGSSAVPERYGNLLANLSREYGKPMIVEFGTSFGISTMYLASASSDIPVFTMEGCPETSAIAAGNFSLAGFSNIRLITGPFDATVCEVKAAGVAPGLVFIDGNHRKGPMLEYFSLMADISDNDTVIVLDDIYFSRETEEAWKLICSNQKVSLTIDLWRMGLVFFRKGMVQSHYTIRY